MKRRDVRRLDGHRLTNGGILRGWIIWPVLVVVEHGRFFSMRPVWFVKHSSFCASMDLRATP